MPKKIAEVAKEATILDYEVTSVLFMNYDKNAELNMPLNL